MTVCITAAGLDGGPGRRRALDLVAVRAVDAVHHHPAQRAGQGPLLPVDGRVVRARRHRRGRHPGSGHGPPGPRRSAPSSSPPTALGSIAFGAALRGRGVRLPASAGSGFPIHRRQVNERWLDQYRSWVYGSGFGWQIGNGLSTYITTAAVYLMVVLGALTAAPVPPWPSASGSAWSGASPCC